MKQAIDPQLPLLQDADLEGKVVLVRVDHNVVKKGTILYEMEGVPEQVAREALRLASHKLPLTTKVLSREVFDED